MPDLDRQIENSAREIARSLTVRGATLSVAESCTGGWIAKVLTDLAGSSQWFDRGFVTYSNEAKQDMLGVPEQTLVDYGAVSESTVAAMASGVLEHSESQFSLSISGVAGPSGGSKEKPVGMVCFGWDDGRGHARQETRIFDGDRDQIRRQAVLYSLNGLLRMMGVSSKQKRLFFALWPDEGMRRQLGACARSWTLPDSVKRHPDANLHVTLEFIGSTDLDTQVCMERAVESVRSKAFDIQISGSGIFKRAQVAWLGVESADQALQNLQSQLVARLADCGYQKENRPFKPHMTVARKMRHRPPHHDYQAVSWSVTRFALVESRSGEHGVEYVPLRFWDLD